MTEPYDIQLAASATGAIQDKLPENVAAAVIEFITGSLRTNPRRIGKPLTREVRGRYAARRGTFRIIYSIDDAENLITVLRIEHRADVYRPTLTTSSGGARSPHRLDALRRVRARLPALPRRTHSCSPPAPARRRRHAIARDAIDLFAGPVGHRIRVCAAEDCAFLFVDAARPGSRRWCSMQRCGNLAKVRAHRATATTGE